MTVKPDCPHCDRTSPALRHILKETEHFFVVCDAHPIVEGHILIVSKRHVPCFGAYTEDERTEFAALFETLRGFLKNEYGAEATFEHGNTAQTVFHSHVHIVPYGGSIDTIVPEGRAHLTSIKSLGELKTIYERDGKFLFVSIGDERWVVDPALSAPRFFRDRFAGALGNPERGNWRRMKADAELMALASREIEALTTRYERWLRRLGRD